MFLCTCLFKPSATSGEEPDNKFDIVLRDLGKSKSSRDNGDCETEEEEKSKSSRENSNCKTEEEEESAKRSRENGNCKTEEEESAKSSRENGNCQTEEEEEEEESVKSSRENKNCQTEEEERPTSSRETANRKTEGEEFDWMTEKDGAIFKDILDTLIEEAEKTLPDIGKMFAHRKINCLLLHSVNYMARPGADYYKKERFIEFVVRYGNKDIIELDKDDKPISICPTPMHDATRHKLLQRNEMVRELFKKYERLKVNCVDDPPLSLAIKKELKNVIEFLLKVGADPNSANDRRSTPLHLICTDDDGFMEHFLDTCKSIKKPVQVNAQDSEDKTPLHIALVRVKETHYEWLHDRLQEICLEAQDASDRASLPKTVVDESKRSVQLLLRAGADPKIADAEGSTALHVICKRGDDNDNLMKMLFAICDKVGMTVQVDVQDNTGNTPLHLALEKAHIALTEVLLKRDADPNVANNEGDRPLHVICNRKIDDNLMKLFLELCKDLNNKMLVDVQNELHKTPLQLAVEYLMPDVVYALLHYDTDLPSFVFPSAADFKEYLTVKMFESPRSRFRCDVITDALFVIRHLVSAKYELCLNEAVMIMSVFAECGSFEMSASLVERLSREKYFSMEAQRIQTSEGLSLYDLMKLPIDEAARRFNYKDFKSTLRTHGVMARNDRAKLDAVAGAISLREFFQDCAVEAFWMLTHQRIPIECCAMIIGKLAIEDLYHICLAFASLSQKKVKKSATKK